MGEKKKRGARAGMLKRGDTEVAGLDRDGVRAVKDVALPAGPEHFHRDMPARLAAHLLANQPGGNHGTGTTYHAFEVLAACAARAIEVADDRRAKAGKPPVREFAREWPDAVVRVPVWALVAIYEGWMRATRGAEGEDGKQAHPLPVIEAFGLGAGGDRTVATKHRNFARDVDVAIAVAMTLQGGQGISENRAVDMVAALHGVSKTTARDAWKRHEAAARGVAERHANGGLSESRQPNENT